MTITTWSVKAESTERTGHLDVSVLRIKGALLVITLGTQAQTGSVCGKLK